MFFFLNQARRKVDLQTRFSPEAAPIRVLTSAGWTDVPGLLAEDGAGERIAWDLSGLAAGSYMVSLPLVGPAARQLRVERAGFVHVAGEEARTTDLFAKTAPSVVAVYARKGGGRRTAPTGIHPRSA